MPENQIMPEENPKFVAARHKPLNDPAAELLATLVDEQMLVLMSSRISGGTHVQLYKMQELCSQQTDALPFALTMATFDALSRRGYIQQVRKDKVEELLHKVGARLGQKPPFDMDGGKYLAWYDRPHAVTAAGREALVGLRERVEDIRRDRAAMVESPRFLVAAISDYSGRSKPGAGNLYRIIRETEGRFYVDRQPVALGGDQTLRAHDLVRRGSKTSSYIDKADVVALDVTPEQHQRMVRATIDYVQSVTAATSQMEAEIAPIRRRHAEREIQLQAQLADEMRDAMGGPEPVAAPAGPRR